MDIYEGATFWRPGESIVICGCMAASGGHERVVYKLSLYAWGVVRIFTARREALARILASNGWQPVTVAA